MIRSCSLFASGLRWLSLLVLTMSAGCGPGGQCASGAGGATASTPMTTSTTSACSASTCPAGSYSQCEPGGSVTECCQGGAPFAACSRPAGILLNMGVDGGSVCPAACAGEPCALSPSGTVTCCAFVGMSAGTCDQAVP